MTKAKYRKLFNNLKQQIHEYGHTLRIYRDRQSYYHHIGGNGIYGLQNTMTKTVELHVIGKPDLIDLIAVLAHETRHAMHMHLGLYKNYYETNVVSNFAWPNQKKDAVSDLTAIEVNRYYKRLEKLEYNLGVAVRAERDCDRWANEFLMQHGEEPVITSTYPVQSTATYKLIHQREFTRRLIRSRATSRKAGAPAPLLMPAKGDEQ